MGEWDCRSWGKLGFGQQGDEDQVRRAGTQNLSGEEEICQEYCLFFLLFFTRNTLYSHTWPLSPPPGQRKSHQCTGRCISCVCCGGGCSRCPVLLLPPGSCPGTLGGRPSPGFGTPRSLAASGRHLWPVPLDRPPLQAWGKKQSVSEPFYF